jgi:chromosome segregation ATPase
MNTNKLIIAILGATLGSALLLFPAYVSARQDQDSVVEASRKALAAKKNAPKSKMTIDDDNLGTVTGTISVVGQQPEAVAETDKAATDKAKPAADKAPPKDEAYWRKVFAAANKKLADDAHELDILQREYNLKQQQYYSDPNQAMKEQYNRQDLNDNKQKIDDKTALVAQDKQEISDLEDQLRQAGGDPGWERETPAQSQADVPAQPPVPPPPESSTQPSKQ